MFYSWVDWFYFLTLVPFFPLYGLFLKLVSSDSLGGVFAVVFVVVVFLVLFGWGFFSYFFFSLLMLGMISMHFFFLWLRCFFSPMTADTFSC